MTRSLLVKEGIFSGISSGAAVVGAIRYMSEAQNPGRVIVILPDSGNRYLSKVYNDAWMIEHSFLEKPQSQTIRELLKRLSKVAAIMSAEPTDLVGEVVKKMRDGNISQLPVLRGNEVAGIISETDLLRPLIAGEATPNNAIEPFISKKFAILLETDEVAKLNEVFMDDKVALVQIDGKIRHILTKIDLITHLSNPVGAH